MGHTDSLCGMILVIRGRTMKHLIFWAILFSSCIIYEEPYFHETPQEAFWDTCNIPYWASPEYCEQFDADNSQCCTWNVGYSCHEEWCVWFDAPDCEWEKQWWDCDDW